MPTTEGTVVYDNSSVPGSGTITLVKSGDQTGTYTQDSSWPAVISYRKGLRRPKPKFLDETPYELRKHTFTGIRGNWSLEPHGGSFKYSYSGAHSGGYLGDPNIASVRYRNDDAFDFSVDLEDRAYLKALSSLDTKDVDLGAFFAECDKTAQLLGDVAHLAVDTLRLLRKRDLRGFLDRLKPDVVHRLPGPQSVVDTYLTYHYAVKPTLQDIAGMVQAATRRPAEDSRVRVKGKASVSDTRTKVIDLGGNLWVFADSAWTDSTKVWISATRRNLTREQDLAWALGLDDPLSTAWELTPWSFVYDWAFPVGDWLRAINTSKYYTDWQCSASQYLRENTTYSGTQKDSSSYKFTSSVAGRLETFKLRRKLRSSLPMVGIPFKNPLSVDHAAKGLSLLATTLARGGEPPRYLRY